MFKDEGFGDSVKLVNEKFNEALNGMSNSAGYEDPLDEGEYGKKVNPAIMSVVVDKIVRDDSKPLLKYEPNNPNADKNGYVAYPNINPVVEMSDLIEATRAYQANVAAFESAKTIALSAINILKI